MGNESNGISLINADLPDSVDNAIKNLTDKPTLSIGQTISDLWQLVLGGKVALAAEKQRMKYAHDLEEYRISLENKVDAIPERKRVDAPLQITAQALEDSQFCVESEILREMFSSLIANAMNIDYTSKVHPSFSKIIQQLSPLDAQMLKVVSKWQKHGGIAIVDYNRVNEESNGGGYNVLFECIPAEVPNGCTPESAARALSSLQHLGLVRIPEDAHFVHKSRYDVFQNTPLYEDLSKRAKIHGYKLDIHKRIAKLTDLGKDFVSVCLD